MVNDNHEISSHSMAIRYTNKNFFLAIKPPLTEDKLRCLPFELEAEAASMHKLSEGSQVLVFPRHYATSDSINEFIRFREFVESIAKDIGGVALDKHILPTYVKEAPYNLQPVGISQAEEQAQ